MPTFLQNTLMLVICWVVALGAGIYVTYVHQPRKLKRLEKAEKVERLKRAEVTSLLQEQAASVRQAKEAVRKWRARYKVIPDSMTSPAVVGRLNELTQQGFKNFDISFRGVERSSDYSYLSYNITGRGYYASLYDFVWEIENSRHLYRVSGLKLSHIDLISENQETKKKRMQVMVSFTMRLSAYFGGAAGLSAPEVKLAGLVEDGDGFTSPRARPLPEVPEEVLPDKHPDINPFFPNILDKLPPNTHELVNVEKAKLISIADGKAVFQEGSQFRAVEEGSAVYLGQIVEVSPKKDRVVARLNKGGIIDEVTLSLDDPERYRQAQGSTRLAPTDSAQLIPSNRP